MTWIKHGECDKCGFCCEVIAHVALDFNQNEREWIDARGIPQSGIKWFNIVDPCPKLSEEKLCTIYEDRPPTCRDFPSHPNDLIGASCTFWFENTETGEKLGGLRSPYPQEIEQ